MTPTTTPPPAAAARHPPVALPWPLPALLAWSAGWGIWLTAQALAWPAAIGWLLGLVVSLTLAATNAWSITLTFPEGANLAYKYTLGSWNFVEKTASCGDNPATQDGNRLLSIGNSATQPVTEVVANWRNVAPCGN